MLREWEYELAAPPRIRIRHIRGRYGEMEGEAFDPVPPSPGTLTLGRFSMGGAQLSADHRRTIAALAKRIASRMPSTAPLAIVVVVVEGHEDETGDPARFTQVGIARALAAGRFLATRLAAEVRRLPAAARRDVEIQILSAGPSRPIRSNVTPTGRAQNRRVEIRVRFEDRTI